jgi:serine phosphatase RsbU (regulator of sigma subunit)
MTAGFLIFLVLATTLLAFTFSRSVTKPLEAVAEFRGNQAQEDDLTLVVIKVDDG